MMKLKSLVCDSNGKLSIGKIKKTRIEEYIKLKREILEILYEQKISQKTMIKLDKKIKKIEGMGEEEAVRMLENYYKKSGIKTKRTIKGGDGSYAIPVANPVVVDAENVEVIQICGLCNEEIIPDQEENADGESMEDHVLHGQHHFHLGCLITRFPANSRVTECVACPYRNCNRWCVFPNYMDEQNPCSVNAQGNLILRNGHTMDVEGRIFNRNGIERSIEYYTNNVILRNIDDDDEVFYIDNNDNDSFGEFISKIIVILIIILIASYIEQERTRGGKRTRKPRRMGKTRKLKRN